MEITGEMEVHFLHRHHLCIAATGRATLHAEAGAERSFADADRGLLANGVQPVDKAHRGGGLALTCRCRVDCGHLNQLAVRLAGLRLDEFS